MRLETTFSNDFDDWYNSFNQTENGKKLLDCEGISRRCLDVGQMSHAYFTENFVDVTIDANANSGESKNPNAYGAEIVKGIQKLEGMYLLHRYAHRRFGIEHANEIMSSIVKGDLYFHDSSSVGIQLPYCTSISTTQIMNEGRPYGQLHSQPPKYAMSFIGQVIELIMNASQTFAGAVAVGDLFVNYCYYAKKENRSNIDILNDFQRLVFIVNNPFRISSQCVDSETEVLTPNGFKTYETLHVNDDIYVWKDGNLEIEKVNKVNISHYNGEMHEYSGRDLIQTVTPNHKVFHLKNNHHLYDDKYVLTDSCDLINMKTPLTIPVATLKYDADEYPIKDSEIQLSAITLCDGEISAGKFIIHKSKNRYGNELIEECLNDLELSYRVEEHCIDNSFGIEGYQCNVNMYIVSRTKHRNEIIMGLKKDVLPDWIFRLSRRQANLFIDTWAMFDGHTSFSEYGRQKLQVDNYHIADQMQHLCVIAGRGSRIVERLIGDNKKPTIYVIPYIRVNKSCINASKILYNGIVWCPSTDAGIVIYRKNGKVFISGNSPFTNLSIFDVPNLQKLFGMYVYPDGSKPDFDYIMNVQKMFCEWFSKGDPSSGFPFRFPVVTTNICVDKDKNIIDNDFLDFVSSVNCKSACFNIYVNSGNKISSCCRLLNDLDSMPKIDTFGNGSIGSVGSVRVVTLNMPRISIKAGGNEEKFFDELQKQLENARDLLIVHREDILQRRIDSGFLHFFNPLKWLNIKRYFSTFGIIGIYEANYFMGLDIRSEKGIEFTTKMLKYIENFARETSKLLGYPMNVEEIPGESVAIKFVKKDKIVFGDDKIPFELYSNQYIPLIIEASLPERIKISGKFQDILSGGGILHLNVKEQITDANAMKHLIKYSANNGVSHMAVNYGFTKCADGHTTISGNTKICPICSKPIVSWMTRIVGYNTLITSWSKVRREYEFPRRVFS